ncbi:MAG: hypothetical protein U0414_12000 [Polyangiaceae bacterium]
MKIDPVNLRIRRALADAAADAGELDSAQRTYRALLLVIPRSAGGAKPEITRAEVLLCLSSVAERLGDASEAAECEESALAAARESDWDRAALERELLARGRHARLAELLSARVESLDAEQAAAACDQLVRLYDDHLGRTEDAFVAALRAVSLTPTSGARHAVALDLGRRAGRAEAYLDVVREQSARAKSPRRRTSSPRCSAPRRRAPSASTTRRARSNSRSGRRSSSSPTTWGGAGWITPGRPSIGSTRSSATTPRAPVLARRLAVSEARGEPAAARANGLYDLADIELGSAETSARGVGTLERALAADPRPDVAEAQLSRALAREPGLERAARLFVEIARAPGRERTLVDALERLGAIELDRASLREAANVALAIGDRARSEALLRRFIELAEQRPAGAPSLSVRPPTPAERGASATRGSSSRA